MTDLKNNIESLREKLCFLLLNKELTDIEVVICSQELDKLLVHYQEKMNLKRTSKIKMSLKTHKEYNKFQKL